MFSRGMHCKEIVRMREIVALPFGERIELRLNKKVKKLQQVAIHDVFTLLDLQQLFNDLSDYFYFAIRILLERVHR